MVSVILFSNMGKEFSNSEIRAAILKRFGKKIYRETVTNALKQIDYSTGLLNEKIRTNNSRSKSIPVFSVTL